MTSSLTVVCVMLQVFKRDTMFSRKLQLRDRRQSLYPYSKLVFGDLVNVFHLNLFMKLTV